MPQTVAFTKGQGTGNDFVIIPDPDGMLELSDAQVSALCDRRFGIGADGTLRVVRSAALPEGAATPDAEWFMDYRNADGSAAEMCGNGIRVFAKYLVETGLADIDAAPIAIGTRAGTKRVTRSDLGFEVDLGLYAVDESDVVVHARGLDVPRPGVGIDVGNPHIVIALGDPAELDALDLTVQPVATPRRRTVRTSSSSCRPRRATHTTAAAGSCHSRGRPDGRRWRRGPSGTGSTPRPAPPAALRRPRSAPRGR